MAGCIGEEFRPALFISRIMQQSATCVCALLTRLLDAALPVVSLSYLGTVVPVTVFHVESNTVSIRETYFDHGHSFASHREDQGGSTQSEQP